MFTAESKFERAGGRLRADLDKGGVEGDASLGIEDGGVRVMDEVSGHHVILGVAQDALQSRRFGCLLDCGADLFVGSWLLQHNGQIHHRDVRGWDTAARAHADQMRRLLALHKPRRQEHIEHRQRQQPSSDD